MISWRLLLRTLVCHEWRPRLAGSRAPSPATSLPLLPDDRMDALMKQVLFPLFTVPKHNACYEGEYPAREFDWLTVCARDKASNLHTLLGGRRVATVLEVGCGSGAVLSAVIDRGVGTSHKGVDMADPTLHRAPQAANLDIAAYDGSHLPFADRSFELSYSSHVVEHVPDPRAFVQEVARVSARWVYFEVPCELHLRADTAALQRTLDIGHINAYTPESFVLLLQTAGLQVVDARVFDHSAEVQGFFTSPLKGRVKQLVRSSLLAASPKWAPRLFTYHVGVLCAR